MHGIGGKEWFGMGNVNLAAVFAGAAAFFALGALWYGPLFGKAWRNMVGVGQQDAQRAGQKPVWLIMVLAFAFELLIALMLGHQFAMTSPSPRGMMMIATGYGATLMAPALGINYLFQMRPGKLFAIDAGYFIAGMALMGAVFVALS
jgi:hypothetical protein